MMMMMMMMWLEQTGGIGAEVHKNTNSNPTGSVRNPVVEITNSNNDYKR
jgi:hypothetical protein